MSDERMSTPAVSAEALMQIALELVDLDHVPSDSKTYVSGDGIQRVPLGLDIGTGELPFARQRVGFSLV